MSKEFNKIIGKKTIHTIPLVIIELLGSQCGLFKGLKAILAQHYLSGEYIKYNNNYGWVNNKICKSSLIAQAFSHFTYEFSMGTILVVDVQGVFKDEKLYITDPAIHSIFYKERFGNTNHGKLGIVKFFQTHVCTDYCKKLGLINPKNIQETELKKLKEAYKGEKNLKHLYAPIGDYFTKWKERIQSFNLYREPVLSAILEQSDSSDSSDEESEYGCTVSSVPGEFISPKD